MAFHPDSIESAELPGAALVRSREIKEAGSFSKRPPGVVFKVPICLTVPPLPSARAEGNRRCLGSLPGETHEPLIVNGPWVHDESSIV